MPHFLDEAGLIHKGSMGDVVMFEDARHPGLTMSARSADLNSAASARALADQKIQAHLSKGGTSLEAIKARLAQGSGQIAAQAAIRKRDVAAPEMAAIVKRSGGTRDGIVRHYEAQVAQFAKIEGPARAKLQEETEAIAHHFEGDPDFLQRAQASGVRTRKTAAEQFKQQVGLAPPPPPPPPSVVHASQVAHQVAHSGHTAPTRVAQISGLSEKGIMARMRKILTSFGSPWRGLSAEPGVQTSAQIKNRRGLRQIHNDLRDALQKGRGQKLFNRRELLQAAQMVRPYYQPGQVKFLGSGNEQNAIRIGNNKVLKLGRIPDQVLDPEGERMIPGAAPNPPRVAQILQPIETQVFTSRETVNTSLFGTSNKFFGQIVPEAKHIGNDALASDKVADAELRLTGQRIWAQGYVWRDEAFRNAARRRGRYEVIDYGFIDKLQPYEQGQSRLARRRAMLRDIAAKSGIAPEEYNRIVNQSMKDMPRRGLSLAAVTDSDFAKIYTRLRETTPSPNILNRPATQVARDVSTSALHKAHAPKIEGLKHGGVMSSMRKILTDFGSGWQGLDAQPFVFRTSPDLSSGKADGFVTDVYHKTPKGEDWVGHVAFGPVAGDTRTASVRASMLAQDFRGKGLGQTLYLETMEAASNEGFTHFMSDATGSVSESAQKMWSRLEPEVGAIRSTLKGKPSWKVDLVKNRGIMRAARTKAGAGRVAEAIPRLMKGL